MIIYDLAQYDYRAIRRRRIRRLTVQFALFYIGAVASASFVPLLQAGQFGGSHPRSMEFPIPHSP